jgi:thiol:disulfide interchange protein
VIARICGCVLVAAVFHWGSMAVSAESTLGYDSTADPFVQLREAQVEAKRDGKRILVIAGGDWCIWCHYLNAFLHDHDEVSVPLDEAFVIVKAYLGDENKNAAFFATLPEAAGYPHFWVLAEDGRLLQSQNTLPLEDGGKSYDVQRFLAFIDEWGASN